MKFFLPYAEDEAGGEQAYLDIRKNVGKGMEAEFSDRRVRLLRWRHDGRDYVAEVGEKTSFNGEVVIAIFYEQLRNLYHVLTPSRGVLKGPTILAGSGSSWEDFDQT